MVAAAGGFNSLCTDLGRGSPCLSPDRGFCSGVCFPYCSGREKVRWEQEAALLVRWCVSPVAVAELWDSGCTPAGLCTLQSCGLHTCAEYGGTESRSKQEKLNSVLLKIPPLTKRDCNCCKCSKETFQKVPCCFKH